MGKNEIYPKPKVRIHQPVYSAMHAFCNRQGKRDNGDEKGFLLAGTFENGGMIVDVKEVIIFPQKGNGTAVDFDNEHELTPRFWPAVMDHLKRTNQVLVGWAHYYSGGVHHSHHDDITDDTISFSVREQCPIMLSMTWNSDKAGIEGKLWTKVGVQDVQMSFDNIPYEFITPNQEQVIEAFLQDAPNKVKLACEFTLEVEGLRYKLTPADVGVDESKMLEAAIADFRTNIAQYFNADSIGEKLRKAMLKTTADPAVVASTHEQLDKLWTPKFNNSTTTPSYPGYKQASHSPPVQGGGSPAQAGTDFFREGKLQQPSQRGVSDNSQRTTRSGGATTCEVVGTDSGSVPTPAKGREVQAPNMANRVVWKGKSHFVLLEDDIAFALTRDWLVIGDDEYLLACDDHRQQFEIMMGLRYNNATPQFEKLYENALALGTVYKNQLSYRQKTVREHAADEF